MIATIESGIKDILLSTPYVSRGDALEHIALLRVFVVAESGCVGVGEAPAIKDISGETLESISGAIEEISSSLLGLSATRALDILHRSSMGATAKAALDIALVTLLAKEQKQSLWDYLAIEDTRPIKRLLRVTLNAVDIMLRDAKLAYARGAEQLKIVVGADIADALAITQELSRNLPQIKLLIDANQAWSLEQRLSYIDGVRGFGVAVIEQPILKSDRDILADIGSAILEDIQRVIESKSADMIDIKLIRCGGITKTKEILEYARVEGIKCILSSMLEGPYSINAALHLAFAYRDVIEYVDIDSPLYYKEPSMELAFEFRDTTIEYLAKSDKCSV